MDQTRNIAVAGLLALAVLAERATRVVRAPARAVDWAQSRIDAPSGGEVAVGVLAGACAAGLGLLVALGLA